jgi:hypothetical protein
MPVDHLGHLAGGFAMSIIETDIKGTERSVSGRASAVAPQALAAITRLGTVGAAILGSLLWIVLALFGL